MQTFAVRTEKRNSRFYAIWLLLVVAILLPFFLFGYIAYAVRHFSYELSADAVVLRYGLSEITLPYADLDAVHFEAEPGRMRRSRGTGTSLVQTGWYALSGYGRVYRLTTRGHDLVYLDVSDTAQVAPRPGLRYVISPERPQDFVADLSQRLAEWRAGGRISAPPRTYAATLSGEPPAIGGFFLRNVALLFIVLLPALVLPFFLWHGRRSLRYRVGKSGISIRHLFGEHNFSWSSIQDVRRHDEPLHAFRSFGAAMPGYAAGNFFVRGLGSVRVYGSGLRPPVVVIERKGGRVIITPEDVDGFVAACRPHLRA